METAAIILRQIIIMFLFMGIGWAMYKRQLITKEGSKSMAHLLLYVVLPCVIIKSFCLERTEAHVRIIFLSFAGALMVLLTAMLISNLLFRKRPIDNFGVAFSNAGFMGIPLITATMGEKAVIYVVAMIALLNALQWTYGQMILSGDRKAISLRAVFHSPIIAALAIGACVFFLQIPIPDVIMNCMGALAQLNAPIAMIILGVYLGEVKFNEIICNKHAWWSSFIRLVIIPAITLIFLRILFHDNLEFGQALMISAIAPIGSNVAVYAQKLNQDYEYAVKIVCLSTLLSIVTMPTLIFVYLSLFA